MQEKQLDNQKSALQTKEEKTLFLAQSDIFGHLDIAELQEVDRATTVTTYPPGRILFRPGEVGTAFFLLKSGRVQLYHLSTDGRKLVTATLEAGSSFGEAPLLGERAHSSFAEVVVEACIYSLQKSDFVHIISRNSTVALALLQRVGDRSTQLEAQLIDTTFKSTPARLAALLLQLARSDQHKHTRQLVVDGLSHEELAERLGVYRETVSTALRDLKDAGAILLKRKLITIINPSLLAEIVEM